MNSQPTDSVAMGREDPIRERYYRPWQMSETLSSALFCIAALLSLATLFVDKATFPIANLVVLTAFAVAVVACFISGIANRLYFSPRAEEARRQEFLSNAFGIGLIHERTVGYYNNPETDPDRRLVLDVLENTFFSKAIIREMATGIRIRTILYFAVWVCSAIWRETPLDWVAAGAQVLFSEELVSKWIRLEWLRIKAESIYASTYKIFLSEPGTTRIRAFGTEAFGSYEAAKSVACVLLSETVFMKLNPELTSEWDRVLASLPVQQHQTSNDN